MQTKTKLREKGIVLVFIVIAGFLLVLFSRSFTTLPEQPSGRLASFPASGSSDPLTAKASVWALKTPYIGQSTDLLVDGGFTVQSVDGGQLTDQNSRNIAGPLKKLLFSTEPCSQLTVEARSEVEAAARDELTSVSEPWTLVAENYHEVQCATGPACSALHGECYPAIYRDEIVEQEVDVTPQNFQQTVSAILAQNPDVASGSLPNPVPAKGCVVFLKMPVDNVCTTENSQPEGLLTSL